MYAWNQKGITSYSLACKGMPASINYHLIKESLKTQTPKLIVIDVFSYVRRNSSKTYTSNYIERVSSCLNYSQNRRDLIAYAANYDVTEIRNQEKKNLEKDFFLYCDRWNNLDKASLRFVFNSVPNYNKGFRPTSSKEKVIEPNFNVSKVNKEAEISNSTYTLLDDMMDYSEKANQYIYFVMSPIIITKDEKEILNTIQAHIEKRGFKFLDTCEKYDEMNIDFGNDYYNKNHMNIYGAEKYTKYLLEFLDSQYSLNDHRNEFSYDIWNEQYQSYMENIDLIKKEYP